MKFPRLRLINKNQRGFTLLEIMVAMTISGLITGGITMTIFQVVDGSARTNNHMIAVSQVRDAGYWVSLDAQMAQNVNIADNLATPEQELVTLTWTDWDGKSNTALYSLENMSGGTLKQLKRTFSKTGDATKIGIIAQFIDPDPTKTKCEAGGTFKLPDTGDKFTITAGPSDNGTITVASGSISSVTTGGGATYNATTGAWTAPTAGGTVIVTAGGASTGGAWTSAKASAKVAITTDTNGNASVSSGAYILTVTATVQQQSETRVYEIVPRPSA